MADIQFRDFLSPIAIVVAGVMVSGSIIWSLDRYATATSASYAAAAAAASASQQGAAGSVDPATGQPAPSVPPDVTKITSEGSATVGSPDAPVVMAYWFDYQCPYCRQLEETVMTQLINDYVKPGKLKIIFKDFVFLGPDSQTAGLAAKAVWEVAPDKFLDWHRAMFDKQDQENGGWGNKADIIALTKTIPGIDAAKVEELMSSKVGEYLNDLEIDRTEGANMGINGTPGAIIGKQLLVGAVPYSQFKSQIDTQLASAQ